MPYTKYVVDTDSFFGHTKFLFPSQINVYTNGSKYHGQVGSGVLICSENQTLTELSFRLPN